MTINGYRVKPLEWGAVHFPADDLKLYGYVAQARASGIEEYAVYQTLDGGPWYASVSRPFSPFTIFGEFESIELAKADCERAYTKMVMALLEPVS